MVISFPPKLSLAQTPTPFHCLQRLSQKLKGPRIWIKRDDLTHAAMSGNKLRKLEYIVAQAIQDGCQALITCGGVQSNHCRATAVLCAQMGLKCHLILRGEKPTDVDGNTLLAHLCGAEITYLDKVAYQQNLAQVFADVVQKYEQAGLKAHCIPTGASNEIGLWGYYSAAKELLDDFARAQICPELICCATGSGGTHAGLALGLYHRHYAGVVRGYAVCDNETYFKRKAAEDIAAWYQKYATNQNHDIPPIDVCDEFIGPGYGIATPEIFAMIREVAELEGVLLDPVYTGKAFYGLLQQIKRGEISKAGDVVFVHTGGIFGLFPYRSKLSVG